MTMAGTAHHHDGNAGKRCSKTWIQLVFLFSFIGYVSGVKYTVTVEVDGHNANFNEDNIHPVIVTISHASSTSAATLLSSAASGTSATTPATSSTTCTSSSSSSATVVNLNGNDDSGGCPVQLPVSPSVQTYVIGGGRCFHTRECGQIRRALRLEPHKVRGPMSPSEAHRQGHRACNVCKPRQQADDHVSRDPPKAGRSSDVAAE